MRPLRLTWLFFRIGALNDLQYRANFWLQLLQSAIQLGTGLAVLGLVFSQTPSLNGWSQPALRTRSDTDCRDNPVSPRPNLLASEWSGQPHTPTCRNTRSNYTFPDE